MTTWCVTHNQPTATKKEQQVESTKMSESTVTVVLTRIRSLLDDEPEVMKGIKDQVLWLIRKIEDLEEMLRHADKDKKLMEIADNSEDQNTEFTYKSRGGYSLTMRIHMFLVDIAYELEDAIDNILNKVTFQHKGMCSILKRNIYKNRNYISHQESLKIQGIMTRINNADNQMSALGLGKARLPIRVHTQKSHAGRPKPQKPPCTSLKLIGVEEDISTLVEKLTREDHHVSILYIVGPAGSGKSTLATELYQHPTIRRHFESTVWASMSHQTDTNGVLRELLAQIQGSGNIYNEDGSIELVQKFCDILKERHHIIIIDDVQDADNLASRIFPAIQRLSLRSKVVITTCVNPSHPYKYQEYVVGTDEKVDFLANKLTETKKTSIYYIPRNPGITMLMSEIYQDKRVENHFESRKWITMEDGMPKKHILFKILEKTSLGNTKPMREEELEEKLKDPLLKKLNLIVVDQVEEAEILVHQLNPILEIADHRSKVVLMTNNPPKNLRQNEEKIMGGDLLDKDYVIRKLTQEQPSVFTIRDLDNSGHKSTLARNLFGHPKLENFIKVWIDISKKWDSTGALNQIIETLTGDRPKQTDNRKLVHELLQILEKEMYLLVLDDIGDAEDLIFDLFAARGSSATQITHRSKIVITVGNPRLIRYSSLTCLLYTMRPLSEDESWDLLQGIVLKNSSDSSIMEQIIRNIDTEQFFQVPTILKRCRGVPLAVVAVAGVLSTKNTVGEWEAAILSIVANRTLMNGGIEEVLSLSYHDLPRDIAPCFLYLGLFPEHFDIPTGILIRMWISEGLVTPISLSRAEETLEDVAEQYLEELAARCIIQVSRRNHIGKMKSIRLHDQIRQLSIAKSAEQSFFKINPKLETEQKPLQRAIFYKGTLNTNTNISNLRTFIRLGKHGVSVKSYFFQEDALALSLEPLPVQFKLLRVLILCGISSTSETLPEQIGDLIFLTYLGLRLTNIQTLPESIGRLKRLLTLDYRGTLKPYFCSPIPNFLSKMRALRHVYLPECSMSPIKKLDLSTLKNLQTLWGIVGGDWMTEDLENLSSSLVKLGIVNISSKQELEAFSKWLGSGRKQLQVLKLDWHRAESGKIQLHAQDGQLDNLQHLHKLTLVGRLKEEQNYFQRLPSLVKLELFFSHLETPDTIQNLGNLPHLKVLRLRNSYKGVRLNFAPNMFPKLEELQICHLPNLTEWIIEDGAMPRLKKLTIFNCRKLIAIPKGLKLVKLELLEILCMPMSFCSKLQKTDGENTGGGEDYDIVENIPNIIFEAC